jgi:D-3-phosphoglycerate dehydrogenase
MLTVLLSAHYMIPHLDRFRHLFEQRGVEVIVPPVKERLSEEELLAYAGKIDGAICGDDRYTRRVLQACAPRLKAISKWGTGIDSIDKDAAQQFGIGVFRTTNAFTLPVADTVIGYMLAFARCLPWMDRAMKSGEWKKKLAYSLSECILGVVGVGNIGKAVIRRARAFGMEILGNDIVEIAPDFILEYGVEMTDLESLLRRADFVSVNCDLNPTSYHLVDASRLRSMKPTAVLINTARGPIVDEKALVEALRDGTIGGAALDVFEDEPLPLDSPLLRLDNVMLSPHNSNSSPAAWERVHLNTIRNLFVGMGLPMDDLV